LGIHYNRVNLKDRPGGKEEKEEYVLNPGFMDPAPEGTRADFKDEAQDEFYATNKYKNYGEVGVILKEAIEKHAKNADTKGKGTSIEDLQNMVADMPELKRKGGIVVKHLDMVKELKNEVEQRSMFDVSIIEQNLACRQEHQVAKEDCREIIEMLLAKKCYRDAINVVMLYCLRYEKSSAYIKEELMEQLAEGGIDENEISIVNKLLAYGGAGARSGPGIKIFKNDTVGAKLGSMMRARLDFMMESADVNELTQHTPLVNFILNDLITRKLSKEEFAEAGNAEDNNVREIIVYIVGGVTYAEVAAIDEFNKQHANIRVIMGGNCIHNADTFIEYEVE